jgi:hypothetical protein
LLSINTRLISSNMKNAIPIMALAIMIAGCTNEKEEILFNGKDLSGWYTYLAVPDSSVTSDLPRNSEGKYARPLGINNDPFNVFSVTEEDGEPAIRITGEVFGILVTENEYEDYHLSMEFKWGEEKYAPRLTRKRDSGILYHSVGAEGAWGGVWMRSKEFQVQESDVGDFIIVDTCLATINSRYDSTNRHYVYDESGEPRTFRVRAGYCHLSEDFEKPHGEWNKIEIYTVGTTSVHVVNGNMVLKAYDSQVLQNGEMVPHTRGKIQIQSEGAELFYRNIRLRNISELPDFN